MDNTAASAIAEISTLTAAKRNGAATAASAIMECMVAAATPLVKGLFTTGTMQERLLFSLVLTGVCSTLRDEPDGFGLTVSITPETIYEAIETYYRLTGNDIKHCLPKAMLDFAAQRSMH